MQALNPLQLLQLSSQLVRHYYAMKQRPKWPREKIEKYQLEKIRRVLTEAKKTQLYKNLPDISEIRSLKDVEKIPLLSKNDLLNHSPEERISSNYALKDLIVSKSSGSSGKALDVYYDEASYNLFIIAGLRLYQMAFTYLPWHKQTYIYTSPYPLDSLGGLYPLHFISTLNPIADTIEKLKQNPPDLLVCYPSHLRSIAEQMSEKDFQRIRPKAINVNSEMSSQSERDFLGKKFGAFVFDDYSSEELTRIASQCRQLNYHIFEDINYMEVVDDDGRVVPEGELGNLVGTNLHNLGQPLLRYLQGDRGSIRRKTCACGVEFRVLEKLEGRKNDAFQISSGETISSGFLLDLTYGVFLNYPGAVNAFCLVQEKPDLWILELVPGKFFQAHFLQQIPQDLLRDLKKPGVDIQGKIVSDVRKTKSGKANPIISLVKK